MATNYVGDEDLSRSVAQVLEKLPYIIIGHHDTENRDDMIG